MIAIELADGGELSRSRAVHLALAHRGFLVGRRTSAPVLRVDPSLTVTQEILDVFVAALDAVLAELGGSTRRTRGRATISARSRA